MRKSVWRGLFLSCPFLLSCGGSLPEGSLSSEVPPSSEAASSPSSRYEFGKSIDPISLPEAEESKSGVGYEIFVGSFADSNGDGIGDLNGIRNHLDYLASLGVTYLWLTPIHPSSTYHHYDVEDYFSVAPEFGTMEDFSSLCVEAKKRGIKVVLDMVLNHASKKSPWFQAALKDFASGYSAPDSYKDDFVFYDALPSSSPSRFYGANCGGKTVYYEANFDSNMPEFNLDSPSLRKRQQQILSYWLSAGASGFRFDGVYYYYYQNDLKNVAYCKALREFVLSKRSGAYLVGEVWPSSFGNDTISIYSSSGMALFNFLSSVTGSSSFVSYAGQKKKAGVVFSDIVSVQSKTQGGTEPVFFLSNHDQDRVRGYFSKYKDPTERLLKRKLASSYLLLTPGTPFLYYGEEIDLGGVRGNANTDANRRLPFIWKENGDEARCAAPDGADYSGDQATLGAIDEESNPNSLLNHYKALISLRAKYPLFQKGTYSRLSGSTLEDGETFIRTVGVGKIEYGGKTYYLIHNEDVSPVSFLLPEEAGEVGLLDGVYPDGQAPSVSGRRIQMGACASLLLEKK